MMTIELGFTVANLIAIATALGTGIGSYVAVKVDLARVQEKVANADQSARDAHKRIDTLVSKQH
jgi:hypothetical protein